jgi:hypothetical protein
MAFDESAQATSSGSPDLVGADVGAGTGQSLPDVGSAPVGPGGGAADSLAGLFGGMFGGGSSDSLVAEKAVDYMPSFPVPQPSELDRLARENGGNRKHAAGEYIDHGYQSDKEISHTPEATDDQKIGSLDTKEDRLKALAGVTQNDPADPNAQDRCGAASLLAAAIYGGDDKGSGVDSLIKQIEGDEKRDAKTQADRDSESANDQMMNAVEKKLQAGEQLSQADMKLMQGELYDDMKKQQEKRIASLPPEQRAQAEADAAKGGIDGGTMQAYVQANPDMKNMMKANGMSLNDIDNAGDGQQDHWVLDINDPSKPAAPDDGNHNVVYDPYARKDGQVIDSTNPKDQEALRAYNETGQTAVTLDDN